MLSEVLSRQMFADGDTLLLRTGFHGEKVVVAGNHVHPVTICAEGGHSPVLLQMEINGSGWIIQHLTFTSEGRAGQGEKGPYHNGVFLRFGASSANNIVQHSTFTSARDVSKWTRGDWRSNVWSGIVDAGRSNSIRSNVLVNVAYALELTEECTQAVVHANVIENFSGDGIRVGGADSCTIESNTIVNSVELDPDSMAGNHEDGIQAWKGSEDDEGVIGLVVRGNTILNYARPRRPLPGILQGIGLFDGPYRHCAIENNVVVVEHGHGISLYGAFDCRIVNNTVLPPPDTFPYTLGPPWIRIAAHKDGTPSSRNLVRNNLTTALSLDPGCAIQDHNVVACVAFKFLMDYASGDYRPKPDFRYLDTAIIDAGSPEGAPGFDAAGSRRPLGKGIDIGAYECAGGDR
jgi:hypothetical protein